VPNLLTHIVPVFVKCSCRLPAITRIKPKRKQQSRASNPVKALRSRSDLSTEYTEIRNPQIAQKELQRVTKAKGKVKVNCDSSDNSKVKVILFNVNVSRAIVGLPKRNLPCDGLLPFAK